MPAGLVISWSTPIVNQLDIGHRLQFPVILTYRYACDVRVIRLLRQRGLGNSATQLERKLTEQRGERWLACTIQYLSDCKHFKNASNVGVITWPRFEDPPAYIPVPTYKWFLTAYVQDILPRIEEIKSGITSTFGKILKMDSTKKVVKKLAGHSSGTASWATNVANETGRVLMCVLTASEGAGLGPMASGLMKGYANAGVPPPKLLYVDCDCCEGGKVKDLFSQWSELNIRLDIWHFMRRLAAGCTTESHPLYGVFLGRLSQCIFEWSKEDLEKLKHAKCCELSGVNDPSDEDAIRQITKKELATHCRRKTHGVEETTQLIHDLLETFSGEQGCDTLEVPLLDVDQVWDIWDSQKRHIKCIQDPEDIQLYVQTGVVNKGAVVLPVYRCARGSTLLESFHLHFNRFIPGTSASDMHFQAYLLEGLSRWNADRTSAAVSTPLDHESKSYSGVLCQSVNDLSEGVLGRKIKPNFQQFGKYTGELIGIEYLFNQTGRVLTDITVDDSVESGPLSDIDQSLEDEGFVDEQDQDKTVGPVDIATEIRSADAAAAAEDNEGTDDVGDENSTSSSSSSCDLQQAARIIELWNQLDSYDKKPTKFSPRYRTKATGRFKSPKKRNSIVVPGAESTKRCFVGSNGGPAQWPDCSRYVEAIISKLCEKHPVRVRSKGSSVQRWSLVIKSYNQIRDKVINNARVMAQTKLQLVEINQTTLIQWYNKKEKKEEQQVLQQGIRLATPQMAASEPFLQAATQPATLPTVNFPAPFVYVLPQNTAGQARVRGNPPSCSSVLPQNQPARIPLQPPLLPLPLPAPQFLGLSVPVEGGESSRSNYYYLKRRQEKELTTGIKSRKYVRSDKPIVCSKCGQPRDPKLHKQYFGNWYCQTTENQSYEEWRDDFKTKGYGKRKKDDK